MSHVKYAPRSLFGLDKRRDRQTDGRTPYRHITLSARRGQRQNAAIYDYTQLNIKRKLYNLN